jgi:LysM repeat protein
MDRSVSQPKAAEIVQADISGEISGQVAVGNYNLQIGSVHGGVVNINLPDQRPRLRPRATPVMILPRRIAGLLDRVDEIGAAEMALTNELPVEFSAQSGLGKTTLLRLLARHSLTEVFPDGVIYLSARDQRPGDLLQSIFDALYEYDAPYKPSEGEIRYALQGKRALILLDDVDLSREEVEGLFDAAQNCTFLLASPDRKLWGEGRTIFLPGLPLAEARTLLERELGRKLKEAEVEAARELWERLTGSPLALIQVAALARERDFSLESLVAEVRAEEPKKKVAARILAFLSSPEQKIVAAIGALDGAALKAWHIHELTQVEDSETLLDGLQKQGVIQASGSGYRLAGFIPVLIEQAWDMGQWRAQALSFFRTWATGFRKAPFKILEEADALLHLSEWARDNDRWEDSLELVRLVEGSLAISGRWEAWGAALQHALQAAQSLGDLAEKAWALHQLGTRLLCLGDQEAARSVLIQALRLRTTLGDRAGAAMTRHNLNLLFAPGGNGSSQNGMGPKPRFPLINLVTGAVLALPVLAVVIGLLVKMIPPLYPTLTPTTTYFAENMASLVPDSTPKPSPFPSITDTPFVMEPLLLSTSTNTPQPTPSDTLGTSATDTVTRTPVPCAPETSWPVYTVRRGDTLYNIARLSGTTYPRLMAANCLTRTHIRTGQRLFVPRLPVFPDTATPTPVTPTTVTPTTVTPTTITPTTVTPTTVTPTTAVPTTITPVYTPTLITPILNQMPIALIMTPKSDVEYVYDGYDRHGWYKDLVLIGSAQDKEDGHLSGKALVWNTDQTSIQAGELGRGRKVSVRLYSSACGGVMHTITLTAVDSQGASSFDTRRIGLVHKNCTPTIRRVQPGGGEYPPNGTINIKGKSAYYLDINVAVDALDARNRHLDGNAIAWTTDKDEVQNPNLGHGASTSLRLILPDHPSKCGDTLTHHIRVVATDGEGFQAEKSINITIKEACSNYQKTPVNDG